jgi:drug/metabolite transporter (DMT)-like permease
MSSRMSPRLIAVLQALLVTFLWSTSWVLIKVGLHEIPALTFAGLRYSLAFLCLLPFVFRPTSWASLRSLSRRDWLHLTLLGLLFYTLTQGAQFFALAYLPSVTVSLLLNFTTLLVALLGIQFLAERPTPLQWAGTGLFLSGVFTYFYPVMVPAGQVIGLAAAGIGVLANSGSSLLGRYVNRSHQLPSITVTTVSMGIGAAVLLATSLHTQGLPTLGPTAWAIVGWLALVNTALAFTLWNHSLRTLSAVESSIINNTMLIQIAVLAWIFLGERFGLREGIGLALVAAGALLVQLRPVQQPRTDLAISPTETAGGRLIRKA